MCDRQSGPARLRLPARLLVALLCIFAAFAAFPSLAQDIKAVSGVETLIKQDKATLGMRDDPKRGTARIETVTEGASPVNRLLYTPDQATEPFKDNLTYSLNGADVAVPIDVQPAPATSRALSLTPGSPAYEAGFKALFILFVLAVILESALGLLFDWRPFVENLNARAVKPLVSFVVALILVHSFELDLVVDFVNALTPGGNRTSSAGPILTAMVIAGGSAGVHNLLVALGYRQKRTPETVAPKPPRKEAWVSVRIDRAQAVGPVDVFIEAVPPPPVAAVVSVNPPATVPGVVSAPQAGAPPSLVGVLQGASRPIRDYFLTNRDRFPGYGGHAVNAGSLVTVTVRGHDASGSLLTAGVTTFKAVGGACVDLVLRL